jgi:hypothetical protein
MQFEVAIAGMIGAPAELPSASGSLRWWLLAFTAAAALYVSTANRGPQWQDSGWQQYRIVTGQIEHPLGLALTHPIQFYIGRAAVSSLPIEPAWATTLVSAIAGAIAIANIVLLIRLTTGVNIAAILAGLSLMLGHTFWQHATLTESYTLVVALLSAEWLCLAMFLRTRQSGWLILLALMSGIGIANHLLAILALPVNALVVLGIIWYEPRRFWLLLAMPLVGLIGASPYLALILDAGLSSGDWPHTIRSALFGEFQDAVLNTGLTSTGLTIAVGFVGYNLADLTLPAAWVALRSSHHRFMVLVRVLAAEAVIYLLFVLRYDVADQYTFFIPAYATLAALSGFGWARVASINPSRAWVSVLLAAGLVITLLKPVTYAVATSVIRRQQLFSSIVRKRPYRDGYSSILHPWSGMDHSADRIIDQVVSLTGPHSVILTEVSMFSYALYYSEFRDRFPASVKICQIVYGTHPCLEQVSAALAAGDPVILIPADRDQPSYLSPEGIWVREGDLYVLDPTLANTLIKPKNRPGFGVEGRLTYHGLEVRVR